LSLELRRGPTGMALYVPFFSPKEAQTSAKLEEQRLDILSQIAHTSRATEDATKPERLRSLKDQYNETIEKKIAVDRGPFLDPLLNLPIELFILLIKEIISRRDGTSTKDLLTLSLVNAQWRRALVSEPTLWTDVAIGNGLKDTDVLARVHTGLVLSDTQPIHLAIDHPAPDWNEHFVPLLRPHASRVKSLIIWPPSSTKLAEEATAGDVTICEILMSLGPLPNLRTLELESKYRVHDWEFTSFLIRTPSIWSITGDYLTYHQIENCVSLELDTFMTYVTLGKLLRILPKFQRLTTLIVEDITGEESFYSDEDNEGRLSDLPLTQLPLQSLNFRQNRAVDLPRLISISSHLVDISMAITWKVLAEVLPLLRDSRLEELALYVKCKRSWDNVFQPLDVPRFATLKSFTFHLHGYDSNLEADHERVERLFDSIRSSTSLQKVAFSTDRLHFPLEVINTLPNLRTFSLDAVKIEAVDRLFRLQSVYLEAITLHIPAPLICDTLKVLRCPNLVNLELEYDGGEPFTPDVQLRLDTDGQYPALYVLEWGLRGVIWHVTSLPSLRIVKFKDLTLQHVSDFCVSIILRPHDCPSLEQIEFLQYPEWDLLYIMLERRNFLRDARISPIRLVSMPSSIGLALRQPLNSLLRGRFANRCSNQDVSLVAITEVYSDSSL
ncbi:hypothetical protein FRC17_003768, partial [Serendipita sp. 399]